MKALVIDNEKNSRQSVVEMLRHFCPDIITIEEADSVTTGLITVNITKPDIVFLDVELDDGTGFDLVKQLKEITFQLVFITGHNKYAVDAFRFSAIDFLIKPIDPELLIKSISKAKEMINLKQMNQQFQVMFNMINHTNDDAKIVLKDNASIYFVKIKDVIRCESDGAYTIFYLTTGEKIVISKTIKEYDELLSHKGFIRVHQSHLIQIAKIKRFERASETLILENNDHIPVSQRKREEVLTILRS